MTARRKTRVAILALSIEGRGASLADALVSVATQMRTFLDREIDAQNPASGGRKKKTPSARAGDVSRPTPNPKHRGRAARE